MTRYRDLVAFCIVACLWGLSLAAVEIGLQSFPPLLLSALRYYIAGLLLLGYTGLRADRWVPSTRADLIAVGGGGVFWIAIGNGVWFVGQELTTSILSGFMASLTPIATGALSWIFLPEDRLSFVSVMGLFISFGGAILMIWPTEAASVSASLIGKAILFVGVLGLGVGSVLIRRASTTLSNAARVAWSALLGAVVIHGLSIATGEHWVTTVTTTGLMSLLYLSVGATVIGYLLFFLLLDRHPAIEVTLLTYLVPLVAAATGWALFGEQVTQRMVMGFIVILIGFCLMKRHELRAEVVRFRR